MAKTSELKRDLNFQILSGQQNYDHQRIVPVALLASALAHIEELVAALEIAQHEIDGLREKVLSVARHRDKEECSDEDT